MRIGLIADTHLPALIRSLDDLGPEAGAFFKTVDLILHAGDVTAPAVLDWLESFAPVLVAQGNNDEFDDPRMRPVQILQVRGWRIGMIHNLAPETRPVAALRERCFGGAELDILIGGHTHLERIEAREGALVINSGSPTLPHHKETRLGTLGLLEFDGDHVHAEVFLLGHTPERRNPSQPLRLLHRRP
jgi:putative phosphoesterase